MQAGQYGKDPEADFLADAAADACIDWVNAWAALVGKPETDEDIIAYRSTRSKFYNTLDWYYRKNPFCAYLTGGTPLTSTCSTYPSLIP